VQELRYAWRGLRRTPGFTAVAIVTLALGIGANTTFFGLVDAIVFRPTAIARLDRVYAVTLKHETLSSRTGLLRFRDVEVLERTPPSSIAAVTFVSLPGREDPNLIQTEGRAAYVLGERVTRGYADVFGLHAQAGRWFSVDDDNPAAQGVVISDRLWRQWFKADPNIVGRALVTVNRLPHRVIGVAPPGFRGVQTGIAPTEIWRLIARPVVSRDEPRWAEYVAEQRSLVTFIRTRPDASTAQVTGELRNLLKGQQNPDPVADTLELQRGQDALRITDLVALAAGILSFSSLVLLAACANLANMLYARGTARAGEIAVRLSLGASARDIFGLFLAEAAIIAFIAASIGLTLAVSAASAFTSAFPTFRLAGNLGVTIDLTPDFRVFFYAFGAATLAALTIGLLTAWRAGRVPVIRAIGSGTTTNVVSSRQRIMPLTFVSVQITAAVLLLIGAGLFLENTRSVLDRQTHYDTAKLAAARLIWTNRRPADAEVRARLLAMSVEERSQYFASQRAAEHAAREAFFNALVSRARELPGVEAAGITDALPGGTAPAPQWGMAIFQVPPDQAIGTPRKLDGSWIATSPGFLETIGVTLRQGRGILPMDAEGAPVVAVLSRSAAEGLWAGRDPVGRQIHCCRLERIPITVVGVADDLVSSSDGSPLTRHSNFAILSAAQTGGSERFIVVRAQNPIAQVDALRGVIHSLDATVPVFDAGPVDEFLLAGVALERAQRVLTISLGLLALGIAMFGVYGVVGYFVSRRTREFGLRLALGAMPRQILKLVVDYAIHIILIGLLPGVFFASLGTRLFEHQLFGIMPNGITMWVVAPLLMLGAGVLAGLVPARRAARVDPNVTLREL
jgi:putative ABC transport system permease protein